jgi:alpha-mannosidase
MYHKTRWTPQKIAQRIALIEPLVYRRRHPLSSFHYLDLPDPETAPIIGADVDRNDWQTIQTNSHWGNKFGNFMLSTEFSIPADWPADAPIALYLPLGEAASFSHPEALAYVDGVAYAACDRHHQEFRLKDEWRGGQSHHLDLHGFFGGITLRPDFILFLGPCAVVQIDPPTREFAVLARVALGIANELDTNHPAKGHLLNALNDAFNGVDLRERIPEVAEVPFGDDFYASIPAALETLKEGIAKAGAPMDVSIVAAGHAHIDVAWLWTLWQTRRKAGRTFHTVLRLMEQFPDYHFTQSQPQLYDYVRQDYPELFEAIKERIVEGRWETIGGMWVEADCNLSGGESLARQLLLGRTFYREHFGADVETPVLWLPDVFGYAWNLPQLIREAGMKYFFTIKIGWSQYNRLPYDSFWWQGLDGTKVLTHFSTTPEPTSAYASTYNANASPQAAIGTWTNFQQKEVQSELLMAYGYGDGGGGPTREMLENIEIMRDFPAAPQMKAGKVTDFYRKLEDESGDRLPTWNGELYLELHRGTYTTQGRNKRANRKSEFLLHDVEFLAALAALIDPAYDYPRATINKAWELICLNQFHDIIPGSSIGPVYVESLQQYAQIRELAEAVKADALSVIAAGMDGEHLLLAINPTGFARSEVILWDGHLQPNQHLCRADGTMIHCQGSERGTFIDPGELAPYSVTPIQICEGQVLHMHTGLAASPTHLENDFLRVDLNEDGDIVGIFDKANNREVLAAGGIANQFQAFEDRPVNWDAWDVDIFYEDKRYLAEPATSVRVVDAGPLRATLEIRRRILHSEYTQRIRLGHNSPRLDFETHIDWRERHTLLKVAFPVDVLSPTATYEIQWGNVQRPTHRNTSWDWARFETCAQKWVDLSEGGYGVSLLNDCKYGHDIHDNVMRISLLRSPTMPDPTADLGEHHFSYSLFPHSGGWDERTVREAYAINDPILVAEAKRRGGEDAKTESEQHPIISSSFVSVDAPNVVIETVKQAEDGDGIVVRLYETQRRRGAVTLSTSFDLAGADRVNLLEETKDALTVDGNQVTFAIRPYQIVTLRLRRK